MFDIVERNRDHFRSFLTWIDGCTDVSHIASSIADSIKQGSHRYGIFYKGQLVGTINFHGTDKSNMSDGVGYWLDAAHQGNGIMTAATHQLLAIGFGQFRPMDTNDAAQGRAKNRRVTLNILADNKDEVAILPSGQ